MSEEIINNQNPEVDKESNQEIHKDSDEKFPEITDLGEIKRFLPTVIAKLCVIRVDHENFSQVGILLTDGTGFGFNGGVGFLPDNIEKIYPITVDTQKNEVRAVIYLKKP